MNELQARARAFVDEVLIPLEVTAERAGGKLPEDDVERIRCEAIEHRRARAGGRARRPLDRGARRCRARPAVRLVDALALAGEPTS
jgi:hypothetical protein